MLKRQDRIRSRFWRIIEILFQFNKQIIILMVTRLRLPTEASSIGVSKTYLNVKATLMHWKHHFQENRHLISRWWRLFVNHSINLTWRDKVMNKQMFGWILWSKWKFSSNKKHRIKIFIIDWESNYMKEIYFMKTRRQLLG